jgi:hypothetical protein
VRLKSTPFYIKKRNYAGKREKGNLTGKIRPRSAGIIPTIKQENTSPTISCCIYRRRSIAKCYRILKKTKGAPSSYARDSLCFIISLPRNLGLHQRLPRKWGYPQCQ